MNNVFLKGNFIVIFIIVLIVSVTPVSAVLLSESNTNTDNLHNSIETETNELQGYYNSLNGDLDHVQKRAEDYDLRVWKWPKITVDILNSLYHLQFTIENMKTSSNKLKNDANMLKTMITSSSNTPINDDFCTEDAVYMSGELNKRLNTTVTSEEVQSSEIQEGDVVQYLSQGKYPRYLAVLNVENSTENTSKKSRNNLLITPIYLKGVGDTIIRVDPAKCLKLNFPKENNTLIITKSMEIQVDDINWNIKKGTSMKESAEKYKNRAYGLYGAAAVIGGIAVLTALPTAGVSLIIGAVIVAVMGIVAGNFMETNKDLNTAGKIIGSNANQNLTDLAKYKEQTEQKHLEMNITTFDGVPIVKKPPINNGNTFTFIVTKKPDHGDLLMGPGLQFLYGPHEGYTGKDQFTLTYIKDKQIEGDLTVYIQVQPIPALQIPEGA